MPWTRESGAFWKHLHIEHTCICGKVVNGNAFYIHAKHCLVYQKHISSKDRETRRITTDPQGLKVLGIRD